MSAHNRMTWMSALGVVALLAAFPAEARFGKRSAEPSKSSDASSSSRRKSSSSSSSSNTHEATAVGQPRSYETGSPHSRSYAADSGDRYGGRSRSSFGWGFGYGYRPVYGYTSSAVMTSAPASGQVEESAVTVAFSGGLMVFGAAAGGGGAGLDLGMLVEGERLGFVGAFTGLAISADDGSGATDSIKLLNGFMTYSLISRPEGRFRVEGGVMGAFAPDLIVAGPSLGFSGVMGLVGPLGMDGSIRMTAFPYRQVDAQAGLTLGIGQVGLRAGMRGIYLNDAGLLDGVVRSDTFVGPYGGLELVF